MKSILFSIPQDFPRTPRTMYTKILVASIVLVYLLIIGVVAKAQVNMATTGSHSQTFSGFGTTSTIWTDNSTVANWYARRTGTGTSLTAGTGSAATGDMYNFGVAGTNANTERSLGSVGSSNTAAGSFAYGVLLRNTSGTTITNMTVAYAGEQWRRENVAAQTMTFWYRVSATAITNPAPGATNTGWTAVTTLNFVSPQNNGTVGALDGNAPANRTVLAATAIPSLSIPNNSYIMFRWSDPDHTGSDHGLAIDDINITWTIPPSITLADNGTQVPAANVTEGTTTLVLHRFQLAVSTSSALLNGLSCATSGSYDALDVSNLSVRYSSDATLDAGDVTLSTLASPGTAGIKTFPSFIVQSINAGSTGYFFVTCDINGASSSGGNTISSAAIGTNDVAFASGSVTGSTTAGGTQTIIAASAPSLSCSPITPFGNVCVGSSATTSFTISGSSLSATPITVAALTEFTYSLDNTSFSSSLSIAQTGGNFSQLVYVRFIPASVGAVAGNLLVGGGGASEVTCAVSGAGVNTSPMINTVTISNIAVNSALSGGSGVVSGCGTITQKGIFWSTLNGPSYPGQANTNEGSGVLSFSSTLSGLVANTVYYAAAYATNSNGLTGVGSVLSFTTLPNAPTLASPSLITASTAMLNWIAPSGGSANYGYEVQVSSVSDFSSAILTFNVAQSALPATSLTATGLTEMTTYYMRLRAVNVSGSSAWSGISTAFTTLAQNKEILFTAANSDVDGFEFMTLKQIDLSGKRYTDNGICTNDLFRLDETLWTLPSGLNSIPAGTFVRVVQSAGTNSLDPKNGVVYIFGNVSGLNAGGESLIFYTGTANGNAGSCGGAGSNSYTAGMNWGNSGWNSGTTGTNNSKAPATATDFATSTSSWDEVYFSGSVVGDVNAIISSSGNGVRNPNNWSGAATGTAGFYLQDILFQQSDYQTGALSFSGVTGTAFTLNASAISFANANADTRYMVVIHPNGTPSVPADRYTCYSGISSNFGSAPTVVSSVVDQIANGDECGTPTLGNGRVVYFDYTLPSALNISGLDAGTNYEVRVYAINGNGFTANIGSSNVLGNQTTGACVAPTSQSSALTIASAGTAGLNLSWTNGNGSFRIVLARENAAPFAQPQANNTYTFNTDFSAATVLGDTRIVYIGSGNSVNVSGLTPGTTCYFAVYEFNCSAGQERYLTSNPLTGNRTTLPSNAALSELCTDNSTYQLSWTYGSGLRDGIVVFARANATSSGPGVSDATSYTANSDFSLATDLGAKGRVVYIGTGNSVIVTGLTLGVNYTFSAYTFKGNTATVWSMGSSVSELIALPNVANISATGADGAVNLGWTNPLTTCFDEVLVVANLGAVSFSPSGDGSAYVPNPIYSSSNLPVYKSNGVGVTVTGLTNGQSYCFRVFVRKGTQWSTGSEVCASPNTVTNFKPGDLAIVAINTQVLGSGSSDEVCFVAFKDITAGTSFYMTDNGFERGVADKWGDTEGVVRLTRLAGTPTIPAGTVICVDGPYTSDPRFDIFVCGVDDAANWQIDPNVIGAGVASFDLNNSDQVWITQGGAWSNPSGNQNAVYTGNVLYGWSGISWKTNLGSTLPLWSTAGSRLVPKSECFTTSLQTVTNSDKTKYTGPLTPTSKIGWVTRINDASNWTGFASNAAYDGVGAAYDYVNACITFPITSPTEVDGKWTGAQSEEWFFCGNWESKVVPDSLTDVIIDNVAGANNNCSIDFNSANAYLFDNVAKCRNISIVNKALLLQGSANDVLNVYGNLSIGAGGLLNMDDGTLNNDGTINLFGNWSGFANNNFSEGDGTVNLGGSTLQLLTSLGSDETFSKLVVNNLAGISLGTNTRIATRLSMVKGNVLTNAFQVEVGTSVGNTAALVYTQGTVVGKMKRWVNATATNYFFPIGTASQTNAATFNFSALNSGAITAEYIATNPGNTGLPILEQGLSFENMFSEGYWRTSASDGLSAFSLSLSVNATGFTSYSLDAETRLLSRTTSGSWINNGTHTAASSVTIRRMQITQLEEFGISKGRRCLTGLTLLGPATQTLCESLVSAPVEVDYPSSFTDISLQWYQTFVNNNSSGVTLGSSNGANTSSFSPPIPLVTGQQFYFCAANQTGSACPTLLSNVASVLWKPRPKALLSGDTEICSGGPANLTVNVLEGNGNYTGTLSPGNIPFASNALDISVSVNPSSSTTYTIGSLSDESCTATATDLLGTATVTRSMGTQYYSDADGDGYGNPLAITQACSMPVGYVDNGLDCDDTNLDRYPNAEEWCNNLDDNCNGQIDENLSLSTYYLDADGDGYGNASLFVLACTIPSGYAYNALDCNDGVVGVNPGAIEICNGLDDNCNTAIDEVCGPANDNRLNAFAIPLSSYGLPCVNVVGTLSQATPSSEALSVCITGEDVWYRFNANAPAVSIVLSASTADLVMELQAENGQLVENTNASVADAVENANSSIGNEILNLKGLVPNSTYFLCVRNYNSSVYASANFTLCVKQLFAGECATNLADTMNACDAFNVRFVRADAYSCTYTNVSSGATFSQPSASGTLFTLAQTPGIFPGQNYTLNINAIYQLTNGLGALETMIVSSSNTCSLSIASHTPMRVRTQDQCPNSRLLRSWVACEPAICGAKYYQWRFTRTLPAPALPIIYTSNALYSRWVKLSEVPGLSPGTYNVFVRPVFDQGVLGTWSPLSSCIQIIGPANNELEPYMQEMEPELEGSIAVVENEIETNELLLYPNPVTNGEVHVRWVMNEEVSTWILTNELGMVVKSGNLEESQNRRFTLHADDLAPGMYQITLIGDKRKWTKKLVMLPRQ